MKEKIAFPQLVELVAEKASTTTRMSELFLQELFATVTQALDKGQSVTIKGLGSFKVVKSGNDVFFTPDKDLAEAVNSPFAQFKPVELSDEVTQEELDEIDASMASEPVAAALVEPVEAVESTQESTVEIEQEEEVEAIEEPLQEEQQLEEMVIEPQKAQDEAVEAPKGSNNKKWLAIAAAIVAIALLAGIATHYMSKQAAPAPTAAKNDSIATPRPVPVVTDTLSHENRLFDMAQRHYGDKAFWVYIALENQKQFPNYRKIPMGSVLTIPAPEKYGINSDNKQSLRNAMNEAMKLKAQVKAMNNENGKDGKDDKEEKGEKGDKKENKEKDNHHRHHHHHH